jgi:hypothetical protein
MSLSCQFKQSKVEEGIVYNLIHSCPLAYLCQRTLVRYVKDTLERLQGTEALDKLSTRLDDIIAMVSLNISKALVLRRTEGLLTPYLGLLRLQMRAKNGASTGHEEAMPTLDAL